MFFNNQQEDEKKEGLFSEVHISSAIIPKSQFKRLEKIVSQTGGQIISTEEVKDNVPFIKKNSAIIANVVTHKKLYDA